MARAWVDLTTGEIKVREKKFSKLMDAGLDRLVSDRDLTGVGLRTLLYLIRQMDYDNVAECVQDDIVKSVGASRQQVSAMLNLLAEKGYITIDATRRPNKFKVSEAIVQRGVKHGVPA